MKKAIVLVAALVVAATAVASVAVVRAHERASRALTPVEQFVAIEPDVAYTVAPGSRMRSFNLVVDVTLKKAGAAARVVFDFQGEEATNHHYVEITPNALRIVLMQDGVGRVLEEVKGRSFPINEPLHVVVKRREPAIRVVVNDEVVAEAYDETFYGGQAGTAAAPGAAEFSKPRVQPVAEIYFADDFMRSPEEQGSWTELRGAWKVSAIEHASMSANAFQYFAQGPDEAAAVAGLPFWDDYSFEASVKPARAATVGLTFYYRDENNYFRFEWTPEEQGNPGSGKKQLVCMAGGKRAVLAEQPGGFRLNQWYTMKCQATGRRVRAFIDDRLVFDVTDPRLAGGMVGLYSAADCRVYFDDVFVRSHRWFEDRFTDGPATAWSIMGGDWRRMALNVAHPPSGEVASSAQSRQVGTTLHNYPPASGVMTVRAPAGEARAAVGAEGWKNYVLETEIHPDTAVLPGQAAAGRAGILLYYQDETRYYQASVQRSADGKETWTLERVMDGQSTRLDEKTVPARAGALNVRAGVKDGYLSVLVNGERVLEGFDTTLAGGRAGLFAANGAFVSFGPVRVDWPLEEAPMLTLNEIFEHEQSMSEWSTVESDWFHASNDVWVHKGNFPGDSSIEAGMTQFSKASEINLMLSSDSEATKRGYLLRLSGPGKDGEAPALELQRLGEKVASAALAADAKPAHVALKRVGAFLVALVDRKIALVYRDASMLPGDVLGWYARNAKIDAKSVAVASPNARKDLFRKAHTDWRVVKGIWEISNRWECDPRWTFFSGRSSYQLAAIWNKRAYDGNVTMDFYAGPKMDNDRGGSNYSKYFANINCTLAGDGADLTSGYSFLFGGFNNTKTVLVKGSRILAEGVWPVTAHNASYMKPGQPAIIPSAAMNIHHTWFHVKAQKTGNRLRLWIDEELVIDYTDNDAPLTGNRVALWTWNSGMMVARMMLVADRIGECEPTNCYVPSQCKTLYDSPAASVATTGGPSPAQP